MLPPLEQEVEVHVYGCVACMAALMPDHPAVVMEGEGEGLTITYHQLNHYADTLATVLRHRFSRFEVQDDGEHKQQQQLEQPLVSIMMDRSIGMIVSILAVLKAGAAYVPVDPAFPESRQSYIFTHSRSVTLITDSANYAKALSLGITLPPVLLVDPSSGVPVTQEPLVGKEYTRVSGADDMAYVLYTSGSTGKPKGVMVTQYSVLNIVRWFKDDMGVTPRDRVLGLTTFCFDISVLEIFLALISGATLVLASQKTQKSGARILSLLRDQSITIMQATPTTYEMMMAEDWTGDSSIQFLVGGEAFRPQLLPLVTNCKSFRNVYGPTETTIWSSCFNFAELDLSSSKASPIVVPIGKPISETYFYIVGEDGHLVAEGAEGELCIGGSGVARGYLYAEQLTAERFVPNRFGPGRMYHTGDIVKKISDGNYVFARRKDDQIKLNGYRIELGEIEAVLASHAGVDRAVAVVRENTLIAFITTKQKVNVNLDDVKVHMAKSLPTYMIPRHIVTVDDFPQTANGKLDRNALKFEVTQANHYDPSFVETKEAMEESKVITKRLSMVDHVCRVLQEVRGVAPAPSSTFAAMGVDSLGAVMFVRYLTNSLGGVKLKLSELYEDGMTVAKLASRLHQRLAVENPQILEQLHIDPSEHHGSPDEDIESATTTAHEDSFESSILLNRRMFNGMRGALTLLVWFDHFRTGWHLGHRLGVDTYLFVLVSGFTTAIQLYDFSAIPKNGKGEDGASTQKKKFNWKGFLYSRFIGVFPMYYLALLVAIPLIYYRDRFSRHVSYSPGEYFGWVVFYLTGMMTWDFKYHHVLADETWFASTIWNCFLVYAISKAVFEPLYKTQVQRWLGNNTTRIVGLYVFFCSVLYILSFSIIAFKNPVTFFPSFFIGVYGVDVYAHLHYRTRNLEGVISSSLSSSHLRATVLKHIPDVLFLALILCFVSGLKNPVFDTACLFILMPAITTMLLMSAVLQPAGQRSWVTTYLFESELLGQIGYASYPMFLFQLILVAFYLRLVNNAIHHETVDPAKIRYNRGWLTSLGWEYRVLSLIFELVVCWCIQRYFQDTFIMWLVAKIAGKGRIDTLTSHQNANDVEMVQVVVC